MSQQNGQGHKIEITCSCGAKFTTQMPDGEWVNTLRASMFVATHEKPFMCLACKQWYVAVIQAGNVMWSGTPISAEQAASLGANRVLRLT